MKKIYYVISLLAIFLTACEQDEQVFPSGSFEIRYKGDEIFLHSLAKAPHENLGGAKQYDVQTITGEEYEISNPTCGEENLRNITLIQYESSVDRYGNSFRNSGSYRLVNGDKIIAYDIYFGNNGLDKNPTKDILQVTEIRF